MKEGRVIGSGRGEGGKEGAEGFGREIDDWTRNIEGIKGIIVSPSGTLVGRRMPRRRSSSQDAETAELVKGRRRGSG